jgi:hypothetical protein
LTTVYYRQFAILHFRFYIYQMKALFLFLSSLTAIALQGQESSGDIIIRLNQRIDDYVVQQKVEALDTLYGADFVFSHGSGKVEGKESWLKTVAKAKYLLRQHDSVKVEYHPGLAIVRGKLAVHRVDPTRTERYHLQYIRIYAWRKEKWEMISHMTTEEMHEGS